MSKAFDTAYDAWLNDCLAEFNAKYGETRRYNQPLDHYPKSYEPGQLVEFSENGDAYPHGAGGTGHIRKAVTPWADSPHYVR